MAPRFLVTVPSDAQPRVPTALDPVGTTAGRPGITGRLYEPAVAFSDRRQNWRQHWLDFGWWERQSVGCNSKDSLCVEYGLQYWRWAARPAFGLTIGRSGLGRRGTASGARPALSVRFQPAVRRWCGALKSAPAIPAPPWPGAASMSS